MAAPIVKTAHPHIVHNKDISNNSPIIAGTRTPVRSIVGYHKNGLTAEEIAAKLSYLSLSEIYDALAFYYDNKEAIDREIEVNKEETELYAKTNTINIILWTCPNAKFATSHTYKDIMRL